MRKIMILAAAIAGCLMGESAVAQESFDTLRDGLYAGTLDSTAAALAPQVAAGDAEALYASGILGMVQAVEGVEQALYRHGFTPELHPLGIVFNVPVMRNPNPEPLDYQKVRAVLETFVSELDTAEKALLAAEPELGDSVFLLDPLGFRLDINDDGVGDDNEVVASILGMVPANQPETAEGAARAEAGGVIQSLVGFDRADAIWLAGYANALAAQADFVLAHDFETFVNVLFHRVFPEAGLPMQAFAEGGMLVLGPESDSAIADAIAGIHSLNWPVIDSPRLAHVLERLETITVLSRRNWEAILAETDDNHELVPSPEQTPPSPDVKVTDEMVATWLETLDTMDRILAGNLLIPHWRFKQGFDLRAFLMTAKRTDFVMLISGYDALPYLKEGPIADAGTFAEANRVFNGSLIGFAFWFN
ncbi:MAG: hypothetical protein JWR75_152 [Devosia sp.]|nr:hypothetical protein [Devosia sp.]